jgi:hypothetical protein
MKIKFNSFVRSLALLNDLWKFDGFYWTWLSGSDQPNQKAIYGNKGVPSSSNVPGAREGSIGWVDNEGIFWIFGGSGLNNGNENNKKIF